MQTAPSTHNGNALLLHSMLATRTSQACQASLNPFDVLLLCTILSSAMNVNNFAFISSHLEPCNGVHDLGQEAFGERQCNWNAFAGDWPEGASCLKQHPIQANSGDVVTQEAHVIIASKAFHVPALTAAVFVEPYKH